MFLEINRNMNLEEHKKYIVLKYSIGTALNTAEHRNNIKFSTGKK